MGYINDQGVLVLTEGDLALRQARLQSRVNAVMALESPAVLSTLASHQEVEIRRAVAANEHTDTHPFALDRQTLAKLAGDPDNVVRVLVARNPNTDEDVLAMLCGDLDGCVRWAAQWRLEKS